MSCVPLSQCFSHAKSASSPSIIPKTQLQDYKHHFCLSAYESDSILDQGNPTKDTSIKKLESVKKLKTKEKKTEKLNAKEPFPGRVIPTF